MILFDEIEKAHPDVFHTLLQLLDDGRLTDSQGRTVDFKNTAVIMTSNIGSHYLLEGASEKGEIDEKVKARVMAELRDHFKPEFLNRVDETVLFKPLTRTEIKKIIDLLVIDFRKRLADRRIEIELSEKAKDFIAEKGYDPVYGARPLKRFLQREFETPFAKALLRGEIAEGQKVTADLREGSLVFKINQKG